MDQLAASAVSACPECDRLRAAWEHAQLQIAQLQAELRELRATGSQFLQLLDAALGRSAGGAQAGGQDTQRSPTGRAAGASRTSSPSPPARTGPDDRALCAHDLHPLPGSLARRAGTWRPRADLASDRRTPRTGRRDHRASRPRAHLPRLWSPQSGRDPAGGPRPCDRAAPGRDDVLLQRPSPCRPPGGGRGRRDGLRCPDFPGHDRRIGSRDVCRPGWPVSRGGGGRPRGPGEEHRRDRLEREGTEALVVDGGDRDGGPLRDPPAAEFRGPEGPAR